jgi:hypothetical protein
LLVFLRLRDVVVRWVREVRGVREVIERLLLDGLLC